MNIVQLHPNDNVAITKHPLKTGDELVPGGGLRAAQDIPAMHKVALAAIGPGQPIRKYNQPIGVAGEVIAAGAHVHSHNCAMGEFERDYAVGSRARETRFVEPSARRTFQGYRREDGRVGTRNYLGVLTTVNCSATVARQVAERVNRSADLAACSNVDGVVPLVHGTGCGMRSSGPGHDNMQRLLAGYARHPNFAGVLMIGLGCEVMQVGGVLKQAGLVDSELFRSLVIQDQGGTRATIEAGVEAIKAMLPLANAMSRETVPASELTLALQCGGSDAFSGVSANPALGAAVDLLVQNGGSAILAETPEIYGAEHLLTQRAATPEVAEQLKGLISWWEGYASQNGEALNNNPSPGNKAGGLTTILEKSLGAQAKGGTTRLNAVYAYGERLRDKGFVFMDSPGYDPVSVTGQVAAGANVICFTTGRGSAFGFKPVPTIKLATNTPLFHRMPDDMDINCGGILDGEMSVQECGEQIFETVLRIASGERSCSELNGYGDNEFTPWQIGAVY